MTLVLYCSPFRCGVRHRLVHRPAAVGCLADHWTSNLRWLEEVAAAGSRFASEGDGQAASSGKRTVTVTFLAQDIVTIAFGRGSTAQWCPSS